MKKRMIKALSIALLLTAVFPLSVFAGDDVRETIAGNEFAAGETASVIDAEASDIFCAGSKAYVDNSYAGNIFIAGQTTDVKNVETLADVFAAGESVEVKDSIIEGNVYAAGSDITLSDISTNSVFAAGGIISFSGSANSLNIAGETVKIDGTVNGDASIEASEVIISDNAVIRGNLEVKSSEEPQLPDEAQIGSFSYVEVKENSQKAGEVAETASIVSKAVSKITSLLFWIPAMIIVGLILCLLFGRSIDDAKVKLVTGPLPIIGFGALCWICVPVAAIVLAVTCIGLPIAAILTMIYVICIWLGLTFSGCVLGRVVFKNMNNILASLIGVAVLQVIRIVPVIGTIIGIAADMLLLGYVVSCIKVKKDATVAAAVDAPVAMAVDTPVAMALKEKPEIESVDLTDEENS